MGTTLDLPFPVVTLLVTGCYAFEKIPLDNHILPHLGKTTGRGQKHVFYCKKYPCTCQLRLYKNDHLSPRMWQCGV
ncbi:hypothetical protein K504DRAFT_214498 [Pleomassaria siparia CBS 279.74]|uniref:Uncharacterized protein n=1 Tax=Pleomassaria siparia CBS 279.74 TaxID=1314801 RepID=A0A6G1JR13_9PLEO|nr:hypothetical protein K504DRAFT_214498 [Pleomassaria siparia CBS 279.74]